MKLPILDIFRGPDGRAFAAPTKRDLKGNTITIKYTKCSCVKYIAEKFRMGSFDFRQSRIVGKWLCELHFIDQMEGEMTAAWVPYVCLSLHVLSAIFLQKGSL